MIEIQTGAGGIQRAVVLLRAGELVAFPTETVYGLGADAGNPEAVARIFAAKGRPQDHPLIVHIAHPGAVDAWTVEVPPLAEKLMAAFWPGPLTLIVKRGPRVCDAVSGGQDTVGLRCPAHPVAHALLEACLAHDIPGLAAPSANRFGRISPTSAGDVAAELGTRVAMVLEGGRCAIGVESSIVDVSRGVPHLLRPGMIALTQLAQAAGCEVLPPDAAAPRVAGSLAAHYAPSTPLELVPPEQLLDRVATRLGGGESLAVLAPEALVIAIDRAAEAVAGSVRMVAAPRSAAAYAHDLYATLRDFDAQGVSRIVVAEPPPGPEWAAVHDRLARAARGAGGPAR